MSSMTWHDLIGPLKEKDYYKHALAFYDNEVASGKTCYPPRKDIFNAFRYTALEDLKVIIIGQDPYHGPNQAMGLSFSVCPGVDIPPSLRNIYKELSTDIPNFHAPSHGCLVSWARQGVLMLNATLTVEESKPMSHAKQGWEQFTDEVIRLINENTEHNVYLLWGKNARDKCKVVDRKRNLVLECAHPSPLSASRGFFSCHHFSKANEYLIQQGRTPIDWSLPEVVTDKDLE